MHQTKGTAAPRKPHHGLPGQSGKAPRLGAPKNGAGRSGRHTRVVRAPGGFAFVEDQPTGTPIQAWDQPDERGGVAMC
jgi:hypothetical protein